MTFLPTLASELRKTATLPAAWAGLAVTVLGSVALTVLNAVVVRNAVTSGQPDLVADTSPFETAFSMMPLGTVGAVIIGVVAIGSEYTANSADAGGGRQITATLAATPRRLGLLGAKSLAVVLIVVASAAIVVPLSLLAAGAIIGDAGTETVAFGEAVLRVLGGTLYWTLTALMAFAITVLTRSGVIPLIVLIINSSLVSISLLLTKLTPLAHWLPDMAGRRLFDGVDTVEGGLDAIPGALTMGAWTLGLLAIASAGFCRRDA